MAHHNVPEHSQSYCQPHRYGVTRDDKIRVEEQVDDPALGVFVLVIGDRDAVEVDGVGQVRHHGEHVGDGERRQDVVGRRDHRFLREHDDVHDVEHDPERAHDDADVPVDALVPTVAGQTTNQ